MFCSGSDVRSDTVSINLSCSKFNVKDVCCAHTCYAAEPKTLTFQQASVYTLRGSPVMNKLSAIQASVRHNATKQAVCALRHNASFT